jgi:chromosome segregation ATPase
MTSERDAELRDAIEAVQQVRRNLGERIASVERTAADLVTQEAILAADKDRLKTDREAFDGERQTFAEELVRMHTINKIQERCKFNASRVYSSIVWRCLAATSVTNL